MDDSIRSITTAVASGSTEAFARFYRNWFDAAYLEARRACNRDEQFCLDVVQDAMMRVIRSIKPFDDERALRHWLRAVVRSCAYDRLRSESRRRRREQSTRALGAVAGQPHELREQLAWLRSQLAQLDPDVVRLLNMRFRWGWTLQRIASALGLKPGAVDGRIQRSISALRAKAMEDPHE